VLLLVFFVLFLDYLHYICVFWAIFAFLRNLLLLSVMQSVSSYMRYFCMRFLGLCARYKYSSAEELQEEPYWGRLAVYEGGGYTQVLPNGTDTLKQVLIQLQTDEWVDPGTRAIFVDFSAYNPTENLFAVVRCATNWAQLSLSSSRGR